MKALKNNASPTLPAVVIGDLIKEIEQATTAEALQEAAQKAASLTADADKETARSAYQGRVKELKEQAAQNTPDADGVVDDKIPANVADMIQALTNASTTDQLDQLMDSMRDISLTTDEYKAMRSAYDKRLGELEDIPY
jgi:recombination DNA repair RAD52 pathway protein